LPKRLAPFAERVTHIVLSNRKKLIGPPSVRCEFKIAAKVRRFGSVPAPSKRSSDFAWFFAKITHFFQRLLGLSSTRRKTGGRHDVALQQSSFDQNCYSALDFSLIKSV
jgi:hypothetical protein